MRAPGDGLFDGGSLAFAHIVSGRVQGNSKIAGIGAGIRPHNLTITTPNFHDPSRLRVRPRERLGPRVARFLAGASVGLQANLDCQEVRKKLFAFEGED